jgi:putative transposase
VVVGARADCNPGQHVHPGGLGVDVVTSAEAGAGWLDSFISDLTVRGLSGVSLINSETHLGLGATLGAELVSSSAPTHYLSD